MPRTFLLLALLLPALLLTTGCDDDPTGVGGELIGEDGATPERALVPAATLDGRLQPTITGAQRSSTTAFTGLTTRVLAGSVDDPLAGTTTATGYLDITLLEDATALQAGRVTGARLVLSPTYVYGDTLQAVEMVLSAIPESWPANSLTSDTTITAGEEITRFMADPTLPTVTVPMPEAWIAANDTTLRSTQFASVFHGFELRSATGNAVLGFDAEDSQFIVEATEDTVSFVVSQLFSNVQNDGGGSVPDGRVLLQDGLGRATAVTFAYTDPALQDAVVNRVSFSLQADSAAIQQAPAGFVRPALGRLNLFGEFEDGERLLLRTVEPDANGTFAFVSSTLVAGAPTLLRSIQEALLGDPPFVRYTVEPANALGTVSPLFLVAEGDAQPALSLTFVPRN
ncbi:MAG: hypothetical protein AAGI08_17370 [Bacteroidota bacterium]